MIFEIRALNYVGFNYLYTYLAARKANEKSVGHENMKLMRMYRVGQK